MEVEIMETVAGALAVNVQINNVSYQLQLSLLDSLTWISCTALKTLSVTGCASTTCSANQTKYFTSFYDSDEVCVSPMRVSMQVGNLTWATNDFVVGIGDGVGSLPNASKPVLQTGAQGVLGLSSVPYQGKRWGTQPPSASNDFRYKHVMDRIDNFSIYLNASRRNNDDHHHHEQQARSRTSWMVLNALDGQLIQPTNLTAHFLPLSKQDFYDDHGGWSVAFAMMTLGDYAFNCFRPDDCRDAVVSFDTAVPFLSVPQMSKGIQRIELLLPQCSYDPSKWRFQCPKSAPLPTFAVALGSASTGWPVFQLNPSEIIDDIGEDQVAISIRESNSTGYTLGAKFLRKYPALFQVGKGVTLYCASGKCPNGLHRPNLSRWFESRVLWAVFVCLAFGVVLMRTGFVHHRQQTAHRHQFKHRAAP